MKRFVVLLVAVVLGTCACGDRVARSVATDTLKAIVAYEKAVDAKVAAEKAFYVAQRENVQHRLLGYSAAGRSAPNSRTDPEKTVYYGRLRVTGDRDARVVADGAVASEQPKVLGTIVEYLQRSVRDEAELRITLVQRDRELTTKLLEQLEAIDQQKARLATARQELLALSQRPGTMRQLKLWLGLGRGVMDNLKETK